MVNDLLHSVIKEASPYINMSKQATIFEEEIKKEVDSLNSGMLIKVSDFETGKDDGIYLSKKTKYTMHIVKKSLKNDKEISKEDFENLLVYSYIVRALSYMKNSPFDIIRVFTKKSNDIINKYI